MTTAHPLPRAVLTRNAVAQLPFPDSHRSGVMSEHVKCPMGKYPWLATFFVLAFALIFLAHKLGLL